MNSFFLPTAYECGSSSLVKLRLGPALQMLALQFVSRSWEQPTGKNEHIVPLPGFEPGVGSDVHGEHELKVLCFCVSLFPT